MELLQEADFSVDAHLAGGAEDLFVNQQGGKDGSGKAVDRSEGDDLPATGKRYLFATTYHPGHRFHTVIPVPGVADADGDGRTTMSDRWEIAVKNQTDLSAVPSEPEPTEEPADDPPVEPSPGAP
ncbi:hypothetical protein [Streptomyces sp. NPDC005955]|uniref:hypothetical protein n=1 Tax=Streptomyces sp. NPDC005955 TaxID=3364738 RepID=UPI0036A1973D